MPVSVFTPAPFLSPVQHTSVRMAEEELMFTMEEVGSVQKGGRQRSISFGDANASDDEDDDYYICSITDDPISPTKDICHYMKNLVHNKQLSSSLPKNAFAYRVS